jgi:hypothetical protein
VSWKATRGVDCCAGAVSGELVAFRVTWVPSERMPLIENRLARATAGPLQVPRSTHGCVSAVSEA